MKFQVHIKTKMLKNKDCFALNLSGVVFILIINAKMITIDGNLIFMSVINFMLS